MADTRYYYAEINSENICFNVVDTGVEITNDNLIPIEGYNTALLGKKRNGNFWEDVVVVETPTEQELVNAEILLNQVTQDARLTAMDETLAVILLNSAGGVI